jgi:hypothetical protein
MCIAPEPAQGWSGEHRFVEPVCAIKEAAGVRGCMQRVSAPGDCARRSFKK